MVDPASWTAIIPAAGRGSRLGSDRPKILYPVANRLLLEWLLDFLKPNCGRMVFVLSPGGRAEVAAELERHIPGRYEIVIQPAPRGMGDAVELALAVVGTPHVVIVWGDQVALRPASVEACLRLHEGPMHRFHHLPHRLSPEPVHPFRSGRGRPDLRSQPGSRRGFNAGNGGKRHGLLLL